MNFESLPPRVRIGLIIPSSNRLSEPQFQRYAPPGVQVHVTRVRTTGGDPPRSLPLSALTPRIREAAEILGDAKCNINVFHCTGRSMQGGVAADREVGEMIEQVTGRPATTTASAVVAALGAVGVHNLVLVTPYPSSTNEFEKSFLAGAGFKVLHDRALDLPGSDGMIAASPELWRRVTLEEADAEADGYFLSCTNIHSIEVIEELEAELDRPVITSNQATLWYCLNKCGITDPVPGLGRLFHAAAPALAV